jgi:site-specific DNA recombinase
VTQLGTAGITPRLRCAIYTRKSTDEGLDQDFNSLDAQREAAEAYIASQRHEGWLALAERYDDGGFTGGNMDRPALKRLMADIEAGKVDVVVVYKIDRLTRSLFDFAEIANLFERRKVTFVAVTQPFNTSTSIGRLLLHVLLSFAQFEREMISERTRDKMSAARKKGKWIGGRPPLGYDVVDARLVTNEDEAAQVRAIFVLYLEERSLLRVAETLNDRGWRMKSWTTRRGKVRDGNPWDKAGIHRVLTNATYIGKIEYRGERYPGQHDAIVDEETFARVAAVLESRTKGRAFDSRNDYGFLLRGLIRCTACGSVMTSSSSKKAGTVYRYYCCTAVARRGRDKCPVRSVPADAIEPFVVERIHSLGRNPSLVDSIVAEVERSEDASATAELAQEERRLGVEYEKIRVEAKQALGILSEQRGGAGELIRERLAELDERAGQIQRRLTEIRDSLTAAAQQVFTRSHIASALAMFVPVWEALSPHEKSRVLHLLLEGIDYDAAAGELAFRFSPLGIKLLALEANESSVAS